jgi:phosphoribosyl 1,2-cyclic phosphodiesterase
VGGGKTNLLIDAGLTGKKIQEALRQIDVSPCDINGIVITHEHDDHIKAAGILSRRFNIPIYANTNTWEAMSNKIGDVSEKNIKVFDGYYPFEIGDITVIPFPIPHDAAKPCGYSLIHGKKKATIATDIGYASDIVKNNIKNSDVVLLEANHDVEMLKVGPYPYPLKLRILSDTGHLSNADAGKTIIDVMGYGIKTVILGHLSKVNNYPGLAFRTVISELEMEGIKDGKDINIDIARRETVSHFYNL